MRKEKASTQYLKCKCVRVGGVACVNTYKVTVSPTSNNAPVSSHCSWHNQRTRGDTYSGLRVSKISTWRTDTSSDLLYRRASLLLPRFPSTLPKVQANMSINNCSFVCLNHFQLPIYLGWFLFHFNWYGFAKKTEGDILDRKMAKT